MPAQRRIMRFAPRHRDTCIQMQFARTAIVIEPVGNVAVLLNLDQTDPGTDRMDRAGRNIEEIAGPDLVPFEQLLDRTVQCGGADLISTGTLEKPDSQRRAGIGRDHQPAFFLALAAQSLRKSLRVRGMSLDRELFRREDIFDQQALQRRRRLEPHLADPLPGGRDKRRGELILAPRLFDHPDRQQRAH